jgi:hypothetical protein
MNERPPTDVSDVMGLLWGNLPKVPLEKLVDQKIIAHEYGFRPGRYPDPRTGLHRFMIIKAERCVQADDCVGDGEYFRIETAAAGVCGPLLRVKAAHKMPARGTIRHLESPTKKGLRYYALV